MALAAQSHATLRVESAYAAPVPRAPSTPRAVNPSEVTHPAAAVGDLRRVDRPRRAGWRWPGADAAPARRAGTSARGARPPDQPERGDHQEQEQGDHRPRRDPYRRAEPRE